MMSEPGMYSWRNPWLRWSILFVGCTSVAALLAGFIWLPSQQSDFSAQGIWASICRAAGVPAQWSEKQVRTGPELRTTGVVLDQTMARGETQEAGGRGATVALQQCTMCHGAQGPSSGNAPNLAGQYPEVLIKQLEDYRRGDRSSAIMQAIVKNLSARDFRDLATFYSTLPKPQKLLDGRNTVPALVRVGDPMRNIAPCASCHGVDDHKLGAPWLQDMPKEYSAAQLTAFASGLRKNDSHGQMRNMARLLSAGEVDELARFYAPSSLASH
jgi:cytochrome c553